jgi:hypothetical protein
MEHSKSLFTPLPYKLLMSNSRDTTAISEITGQPVSTWSEEWRIETEARAILAESPCPLDAAPGV